METTDGDLLQSDGWEQFQRALGRTTHRVGGVLAVEMPLPFGLRYMYAPRSGASGELIMENGELSNIVRTTHAVFLRMEVGSELSTLNFQLSTPRVLRRAVEPEWTWRTSLDGSDDELLARMHEKHRYNIRLAQKRGVSVRGISNFQFPISNDFHACWALLQDTARRQGIATHPRTYYEVMLRELPRTTLYLAEREGIAIACAIVAYHGDTATYLHGGSAHEHRQHMAPHLLHWTAMRDAKAAGIRWYEWGGISPQETIEQKNTRTIEHRRVLQSYSPTVLQSSWSGLTRFKMGFGGEAVHHPPMRDVVFRRGWYRVLAALARVRG